MRLIAVIMAGGRGERFWPKSRSACPKQFLALTADNETMIQKTVGRISTLIKPEDIYIVTGKQYRELVQIQLPDIPVNNILLEPIPKNTAPCIGLAAVTIKNRYPDEDPVVLVLPSDHLVRHVDIFADTMRLAASVAEQNHNIVTIGIPPNSPEVGYGYIHYGSEKDNSGNNVYSVDEFIEKPDISMAKKFLFSGKYLWNSGMFVWKNSTILVNLHSLLPETYSRLEIIEKSIGTPEYESCLSEQFGEIAPDSIDYGIMEKAEDVYTIPGMFGWDDVGSWLAVERINDSDEYGNVVSGDALTVDTRNTIVSGNGRMVVALGLDDLIIVDSEDAILICAKSHTQDVKHVVEEIKKNGRKELL